MAGQAPCFIIISLKPGATKSTKRERTLRDYNAVVWIDAPACLQCLSQCTGWCIIGHAAIANALILFVELAAFPEWVDTAFFGQLAGRFEGSLSVFAEQFFSRCQRFRAAELDAKT